MESVSIIIVNYNSEKDTLECLSSLKNLKTPSFSSKVVVVDNGSIKPLVLPARLVEKRVEVLRSESNLGFTGGNNLGLAYALEHHDPTYLLLLNNDTTVDPNFLNEMIKCARQDLNVGMVGAKIYFSKNREYHASSYTADQRGRVLWYAGGSLDWQELTAFHRGVDEVDRGQFDAQPSSDFITGCALLIPTSVLKRVGMLDEKYFLYLEDVDLSLRVARLGYQLKFCPSALVWHKNAGSSGGAGSLLHQYYQSRNRLYFGWKYLEGLEKYRVIRHALAMLTAGQPVERRAIWDALLNNMGKQQVF